MKHVVIGLFLLVGSVASSVYAEDGGGWQEMCKATEELSRTVMSTRQKGADMSKLMAAIQGYPKAQMKMTENIIIEAYSKPRYSTKKMQQESVSDFANEVYLECVKKLRTQG